VIFAILAAALFGISTPLAKLLLGSVEPVLLAGLLYVGSGTGLSVVYALRRSRRAAPSGSPLQGKDVRWLAGAIVLGGVLGPVLLMLGLTATPASAAALLLNLEGLFTALLAWFVFHENFDRRIAVGMALILAGGCVLSWPAGEHAGLPLGSLLVAAACFCWGVDNNLTQRVSAGDPILIAALKGLVAGSVNLLIAGCLGAKVPSAAIGAAALGVGFVGYGVSLVLFVLALRHLGTARTGAYFSLAPFLGAAVALLLLREPLGPTFVLAAVLMGVGVWLHLTERHDHQHQHEALEHSHRHVHDEHHRHHHEAEVDLTRPHTHWHAHAPLKHRHPHYPDIHHRHRHS
jgi:drug/metabolite transporter (DMT)-like permease